MSDRSSMRMRSTGDPEYECDCEMQGTCFVIANVPWMSVKNKFQRHRTHKKNIFSSFLFYFIIVKPSNIKYAQTV